MTKRISLTEVAQQVIKPLLSEGMTAIDATVGNGHDTLFLAQCVGRGGQVYGFDIQPKAIDETRRRLRAQGMHEVAVLNLASHAEMAKILPCTLHGVIQAIMFNLGYLPGAEKQIITHADSTLQALDAACLLLAEQAVMTVIAYPGHAGGDEETQRVERWFQQLDPHRYQFNTILSQQQKETAPKLFVLRKIG